MIHTGAHRRLRIAAWFLGSALAIAGCSPEVLRDPDLLPPEPPPSVRRGDELYRYKEYESAIDAYQSYLDQFPQGAYAPRVFYKSAMAAYRMENYHQTLSILDDLQEHFPTSHWVQVDALRGDAERQLGNQMSALQAYEKAWQVAGSNDRPKIRLRIVSVARELDSVELARAEHLVTNHAVEQLLQEESARRNAAPATASAPARPVPIVDIDADISDEAPAPQRSRAPSPAPLAAAPPPAAHAAPPPAHAAPPPQANLDSESDEESAPWSGGATASAPAAYEPPIQEQPVRGVVKVGGLFPMIGSGRDRAERALRAIHLVFGENPYRLELKDTGGNPLAAVAALDDLARDPNVLAVIGPLRDDDAGAVAVQAERNHMPVLMLSHDETNAGRYVVQAGLPRSRMVSALLEYAMTRVRLSRFGVLYPDDPAGRQLLSTFRTEAERRGATIVGTAAYHPAGAKNLGIDKGAVINWRDKHNLQAIFLAGGAAPASDVAHMLQREMPDVTLLGIADWQEIAEHAGGPAVDGVLFTDGFYARSGRPATQEFVSRFEAAYGYTPAALEAQAYDAALLVKRALDAGARSRSEVMRQLHSGGAVAGATGDLRVTPAGVQANLFLLQVYNGQVQEVGGSEG